MSGVQKVVNKTIVTQNVIKNLRKNMTVSILCGDYKSYKTTQKKYAEFVSKNYETAKNIKSQNVKVPMFSKMGLNILKIWFLEKFRIKTPAEKALNKLAQTEKAKKFLRDLK